MNMNVIKVWAVERFAQHGGFSVSALVGRGWAALRFAPCPALAAQAPPLPAQNAAPPSLLGEAR